MCSLNEKPKNKLKMKNNCLNQIRKCLAQQQAKLLLVQKML